MNKVTTISLNCLRKCFLRWLPKVPPIFLASFLKRGGGVFLIAEVLNSMGRSVTGLLDFDGPVNRLTGPNG